MRQLFAKQKVVLSHDDRQLLEWLVQGRYAIVISPSETAATGLKAKGLQADLVGAEQFKEGSYLTAGNGSVVLINRAPNPNAARVFLNWLLTREAQTTASQLIGHVSRRLDVPRDHVNPSILPKEGVDYQPNYKEEYVNLRDEVVAVLKEVLKN
jgi:ABC-type Fe3+ transport system substrate-binding protein